MVDGPSDFTVSIHYDRRLYEHDIAGSMAHVRMLARQGIIDEEEMGRIVDGLMEIREEISSGEFPWKPGLEDLHMNIENRLAEKIGSAAGKLHTARSRNDQIALDMRMYARQAIAGILGGLHGFREIIVDAAEAHADVVLPGYTHLQRGQPVLLAHHLLAYFEMLGRDGSAGAVVDLNRGAAAEVLSAAAEHARDAGIGWESGTIRLKPAPKLLELIRRSRKQAATELPAE